MEVTATPTLSPAVATAPPLTVTIPAGGAVPISWSMTAPEKAGPIAWTVEAVSKKGKARDRLVFEQTVEPAVPVETRSEEHTSELQSLMSISYAVFCLKKKKHTITYRHTIH